MDKKNQKSEMEFDYSTIPKFMQEYGKFCLWNGEIPEGKSASEADMALAEILAFWCGGDIGYGRLFADVYKAIARYVPERKKVVCL